MTIDSSRRTVPLVTFALIALNVLFFFVETSGGDAFVKCRAFVPRRFSANPAGDVPTLFTSMFMHAGWLHLGGNMLLLLDLRSTWKSDSAHQFLVFYLLCGLAATFAQLAFSHRKRTHPGDPCIRGCQLYTHCSSKHAVDPQQAGK